MLAPRKGESKLRTFRDGWRSLRMMLLYSPNKLFFVPGTVLLALGLLLHSAVLLGLVRFGGRPAAGVTAVFATILSVVGFQILSLGLHAKTYSWSRRFDRDNRPLATFYRRFKLEAASCWARGLVLGGRRHPGGIVVSGSGPTCCRCRTRSGPPSGPRWSSWASARCSPRCSSPRCP